jgi:hypothetical protein
MPTPTVQPNQVVPPAPQPNKAFTNATAPAPPVERIPTDAEIIAKPLALPDFINLKPKNRSLVLYWGNRAVGDKESKMRYSQLLAMGFRCAKPEDVYLPFDGQELPCPESLAVDNRIIWGDVIAMLIEKTKYVGQTKWNAETARKRVQRPGMITQKDEAGNVRETPLSFNSGKLRPFVPSQAEADAKTGADTDPTRDI